MRLVLNRLVSGKSRTAASAEWPRQPSFSMSVRELAQSGRDTEDVRSKRGVLAGSDGLGFRDCLLRKRFILPEKAPGLVEVNASQSAPTSGPGSDGRCRDVSLFVLGTVQLQPHHPDDTFRTCSTFRSTSASERSSSWAICACFCIGSRAKDSQRSPSTTFLTGA